MFLRQALPITLLCALLEVPTMLPLLAGCGLLSFFSMSFPPPEAFCSSTSNGFRRLPFLLFKTSLFSLILLNSCLLLLSAFINEDVKQAPGIINAGCRLWSISSHLTCLHLPQSSPPPPPVAKYQPSPAAGHTQNYTFIDLT